MSKRLFRHAETGAGADAPAPVCLFLLALELEPVGDHGDELRIGGLALGVAHRVAEGFNPLSLNAYRRYYPA